MSNAFDFVMIEHAAWLPSGSGHRRVFGLPDGGRYLFTASSGELTLHLLTTGSSSEPMLDTFTMSNGVLNEVPELAVALKSLGTVVRFP